MATSTARAIPIEAGFVGVTFTLKIAGWLYLLYLDISKSPISLQLRVNQINDLAPAEGASGEVFRTLYWPTGPHCRLWPRQGPQILSRAEVGRPP